VAAAPAAAPLPLAVGLVTDTQLAAYRQSITLQGGHTGVLPVGAAFVTQLEGACAARFVRCVRLDATPAPAAPEASGLDLLIEPRLERASVRQPPLLHYAGEWRVEVRLAFDLLDPAGGRLGGGIAEGIGTNEEAVAWITPLGLAGSALANAGRAAAQDMLRQVAESPAVADRLRAAGAGPTQSRATR
jgi:hypothetical protein